MIKTKISLLALALAAISSQAFATTAPGTFQASGTMNTTCAVSAPPLVFGSIAPAATGSKTITTNITYTCSNGLPVTIAINAGSSGTNTARSMGGAIGANTDKLQYNIYATLSFVTANVIGDGTNGTMLNSATANGGVQTLHIFGNLPYNQYLTADTYTDNLTVTLAY